MSTPVEKAAQRKKFIPSFGKAALWLGVFAFLFPVVGTPILTSLETSLRANGDVAGGPSPVMLFMRIAVLGVSAIAGVAGVILGLLSLFGFGKENGTSRPISGFIGMVIGGLMASTPILLFPAMSSARKAAERNAVQQSLDQFDSKANQLACADGAVVLRRPGPEWVMNDGEQARRMNAIAAIVAMRAIPGPDPITGVIIVEPASLLDLGIQGEADLPENLKLIAQRIVDASVWADKSVVSVNAGAIGATPVAEIVWQGSAAEGRRFETHNHVLYWRGHLVQLICSAPIDFAGKTEGWSRPFFQSIVLADK